MPTRRSRTHLLGAALAGSVLGAAALAGPLPPGAAQLATIFPLPPLPGQNFAGALAVNEAGNAAGVSAVEDLKGGTGPTAPVLWTNRRPALLGLPPGAVDGEADAVDELNRVAGTVAFADERRQAVIWVRGRPLFLPQPPNTSAFVRRMTPQGVVGGGLSFLDDTERAVLWNGNRLIPLPALPGHTDTLLGGVNVHLNAAGASGDEDSSVAVVWRGNRVTPLPVPPGTTDSAAFDINDNGAVLGVVENVDLETSAVVLWSGQRVRVFPSPPGVFVLPLDLNNRGDAVGITFVPDGGGPVGVAVAARQVLRAPGGTGVGAQGLPGGAFIGGVVWVGGRLFRLDDLVPPGSAWSELFGTAINNRRQVVGFGVFNGEDRGFIMNVPQNL